MDSTEEDALLAAVVAGEVDIDHADVQALLARRPGLRESLQRMRLLAGRLDQAGRADRDAIDTWSRPNAPSETPRPVPRRRLFPWLVAAAALLLVGWLATHRGKPPAADGTSMLGQTGPLAKGDLRPKGPVDSFDRFEWNLELPAEGSFELTLHDDGPERRVLLVRRPQASPWIPEAADRRLFTKRMVWTVRALTQEGIPKGVAGPAEVWLSH